MDGDVWLAVESVGKLNMSVSAEYHHHYVQYIKFAIDWRASTDVLSSFVTSITREPSAHKMVCMRGWGGEGMTPLATIKHSSYQPILAPLHVRRRSHQ